MRGFPIRASRPDTQKVVIGWDAILQTYFFEVHCVEALKANRALDRAIQCCDQDGPEFDRLNRVPEEKTVLVSRGTTSWEIRDIKHLISLVSPYLDNSLSQLDVFKRVEDSSRGIMG